ncbi:MAG: tetratricopeptide repeat protein [Breznakibacter sp.]
MQDFLQGNLDDTNDALERYETMNNGRRSMYFDVHQIENLFEHYLEKNQLDEAEKILTIGLKQHPSSIPLKIKSTVLLAEKGRYDQAIQILEQFSSIEKNNAEVAMSLGWLYLKKGFLDDSLYYFDKTVELAFDESESFLLDIGYNLNQEGFYGEAIYYLSIANIQFPENESILFELAYAYDKTEQLDDGVETYLRLLDINPYSENAWYNLGILYNKRNEFDKAVAAYEFSLAIYPEHAESYFNMGNSYAHMNMFADALECYLTYASFGLDKLTTYQYIGECWEQLGKPGMAIRFYDMVLYNNPEAPDAWYGLGTSLLSIGKPQEGLNAVTHAITLSPENADFWFAHARGCYDLNQLDEAILSLERGISFDPEELSAWLELFQLHLKMNRDFDTLSFIDNALVKYPTIGAVAYLAAIVYFKFANDKDLALAYLKVGKRRQPEAMPILLAEYPELLTSPEISKYINKKAKNTNRL